MHVMVVIRFVSSEVCRPVVVAFLLVVALVQAPIRAFTFLLIISFLLFVMFQNRLLLRRERFPPRTRGGGMLSRCTFPGGVVDDDDNDLSCCRSLAISSFWRARSSLRSLASSSACVAR